MRTSGGTSVTNGGNQIPPLDNLSFLSEQTFRVGVKGFNPIAMVNLDKVFEPDPNQQALYEPRFEKYRRLWPLMADYLMNNETMNKC